MMANVEVMFRNCKFSFDCEQPERLLELAARLEERLLAISRSSKTFDPQVILLAALNMQDELDVAADRIKVLEDEVGRNVDEINVLLADTINKVSSYIENLASEIER